ncbi:MAG: hypothetical protein ACC656_04965, partial [Candidatus Heimdallarchaeota archaeon]
MILDTFQFFYDVSDEVFEIKYFFKFGSVINDLYLSYDEFSLSPKYDQEMFICVQNKKLDIIDLSRIVAIIYPKYDKIGVYGNIKFLDNQLGKTCKFLSEILQLNIELYGHGEVMDSQIKNLILMGFIINNDFYT